MKGKYVVLIFLCLCAFETCLVNKAQVYEILDRGRYRISYLPLGNTEPQKAWYKSLLFLHKESYGRMIGKIRVKLLS